MSVLPLFPLQVVLFPNSSLPLHIFEERYKILINECITEGKEFGINMIHENTVREVGCTAEVTNVVRRYDDGRMDIVVRGKRRYRVERYNSDQAPYLVAQVDFLEGAAERLDEQLGSDTVKLYNKLVRIVYQGKTHKIELDKIEGDLSFIIAQKAGLDLLQRQRLLELGSENDRLQMLKGYLKDVIPKLKQYREVERVIRSDGYL